MKPTKEEADSPLHNKSYRGYVGWGTTEREWYGMVDRNAHTHAHTQERTAASRNGSQSMVADQQIRKQISGEVARNSGCKKEVIGRGS
jgi:hypothetical protein